MDAGMIFVLSLAAGFLSLVVYLSITSRRNSREQPTNADEVMPKPQSEPSPKRSKRPPAGS